MVPLEYFLYYGEANFQNNVILNFINLLNDFKETSWYQFLDRKHKNEINKIIGEWSDYSSDDVNSPEIYILKLKDIKRTFDDFLYILKNLKITISDISDILKKRKSHFLHFLHNKKGEDISDIL